MKQFLFCLVFALSSVGCNCSTTTSDDLDAGTGGNGGTGGGGEGGGDGNSGGGTGGGTSCNQYSSLCNGVCIVTVNDPSNCGSCGRACPADEVCTQGDCAPASACPAGTVACNGQCRDLMSDNTYCGACSAGAACPSGKGCSGGQCIDTVPLDGGGPGQCPLGGPPVVVGPAQGPMTCAGVLAQVSFRWGLCTCEGIATSAALTTDAFSSSGGAATGGVGGSVGINAGYTGAGQFDVGGSLWTSGAFSTSRAGHVGRDLNVGGQCSGSGTQVDGDAYAAASISRVSIAGTLYVPDAGNVGNGVTAAGGVITSPVNVPLPCDCSPSQLIDIEGIIAHAKIVNDNASIGLPVDALAGPVRATRLDLPCGRYFLSDISSGHQVTIAAHGRTALFIENQVQAAGGLIFDVDPGAELDVFVGGDLSASGTSRYGSTAAPAQSRFYIAGAFSNSASGVIAGSFYLPRSTFSTSGELTLYGSLFANRLAASQALTIHYDTAILGAGRDCSTDGGIPIIVDGGVATDCQSCRDCGNQACVSGTCGACTSDAQCCAPLFCSNGRCVEVELN